MTQTTKNYRRVYPDKLHDVRSNSRGLSVLYSVEVELTRQIAEKKGESPVRISGTPSGLNLLLFFSSNTLPFPTWGEDIQSYPYISIPNSRSWEKPEPSLFSDLLSLLDFLFQCLTHDWVSP